MPLPECCSDDDAVCQWEIRADGSRRCVHDKYSLCVREMDALKQQLAEREKEVERLRKDYRTHEQNYMAVVARVKGTPCSNDYMHPTDAAVILEGYVDKARRERDDAETKLAQAREALRDLLEDTQHADHSCGDSPVNCPVLRACAALAKLEGK